MSYLSMAMVSIQGNWLLSLFAVIGFVVVVPVFLVSNAFRFARLYRQPHSAESYVRRWAIHAAIDGVIVGVLGLLIVEPAIRDGEQLFQAVGVVFAAMLLLGTAIILRVIWTPVGHPRLPKLAQVASSAVIIGALLILSILVAGFLT